MKSSSPARGGFGRSCPQTSAGFSKDEEESLPFFQSAGTCTIRRPSPGAFTLVELLLVMALLVVMLAVAAPSLGRTLRARNLEQQSARLLSLTEYARDEAASQGIPMLVWVDPETRRFGVDAHAGYTGNAARSKEYVLPEDLTFGPLDGAQASKTPGHGFDVAEFAPDGTLDPASVAAIRLSGHNGADTAAVAQTADGYGYEIVREGAQP